MDQSCPLNPSHSAESSAMITPSTSTPAEPSRLPTPESLPLDPLDSLKTFSTTDPAVLIQAIATRISARVHRGDVYLSSPTHRPLSTRFEAQSKPTMGVHDYLTRVATLCPIPVDALLLGLHYLDRTASPSGRKGAEMRVPLNSLTVHRLMLSCMLLGTKFVSDGVVTRKRASKVGGVTEAELDGLERELLSRLHFELVCRPAPLAALAADLLYVPPPPRPVRPRIDSAPKPPPRTFHRDATTNGIVFLRSQFVGARNPGDTSRPASFVELNCLISHSLSYDQLKRSASSSKSSSTMLVTKLERNQITIRHSQVY